MRYANVNRTQITKSFKRVIILDSLTDLLTVITCNAPILKSILPNL